MSTTEFDRLSGVIDRVDSSFVERERTPDWVIRVGIRYSLAGMSTRDPSPYLDTLAVRRSHVAIHNEVQRAELQPISTGTADQPAVDGRMIRLHGEEFWLYGAVDPETNEILHVWLFPTTKGATGWFLADLHRRYLLDDVQCLVDDADDLGTVLGEDGYRSGVLTHGYRNAIARVIRDVERRTSSFANGSGHVELETAESWLEALAVFHNSRQRYRDRIRRRYGREPHPFSPPRTIVGDHTLLVTLHTDRVSCVFPTG